MLVTLAGAKDACVPRAGETRTVSVTFAPPEGAPVAGLTLEIDYPEDKVSVSGTGTSVPKGTVTGTPEGTFISANDLDSEVRLVMARAGELPPGKIAELHLEGCEGAQPVVAGDFRCRVVDAADPATNLVHDVTCRATVP